MAVTRSVGTKRRSMVRVARGERGIWQRRFWEHLIRNDRDYAAHIDYCHWNPVKHGLVASPQAWPHSSFHRYVRDGILPPDWCCSLDMDLGWRKVAGFGQRLPKLDSI